MCDPGRRASDPARREAPVPTRPRAGIQLEERAHVLGPLRGAIGQRLGQLAREDLLGATLVLHVLDTADDGGQHETGGDEGQGPHRQPPRTGRRRVAALDVAGRRTARRLGGRGRRGDVRGLEHGRLVTDLQARAIAQQLLGRRRAVDHDDRGARQGADHVTFPLAGHDERGPGERTRGGLEPTS